MEDIQEKMQKLLCELLEESGIIILNSQIDSIENRLDTYQDIFEEVKNMNNIIEGIVSKTRNY